jgi:hypothetical protein
VRVLTGLVVVLSFLLATDSLATRAQEATPQAPSASPGVTIEPVAVTMPSGPQAGSPPLQLQRVRLAPGANFAFSGAMSRLALVVLEVGDVSGQVAAPALIGRGTAIDAAPEPVAAGSEFQLHAGDALVGSASTIGELRNSGKTPATLLTAVVMPAGSAGAAGLAPALAGLASNSDDRNVVVALAMVVSPPCTNGYAPVATPATGTPGAGGGGGGTGSVAVAVAAAPQCASATGTPTP